MLRLEAATPKWLSSAGACAAALALVLSACGSDSSDAAADTTPDATSGAAADGAEPTSSDDVEGSSSDGGGSSASEVVTTSGCDEIAALFGTDGSANDDMVAPESSATCDGDTVVITANAIPDYPYVETSPGPPEAQNLSYEIPAEPVVASETTAVPLIGSLGVTLAGIPIFGPTEGTGGDVGSINGILMECGSHNGPTGFHLHLLGTSDSQNCDFTPEEVASGPQLLGYAFDGYPIYTGNEQYTSSWELTDETLFASDTWAAHTYVEGSGDLDECNGRTDADGNYAYYTTDAFPYMIGCFVGEVELGGGGGAPAGDGEGGGGAPPADGGGAGG